jgi:Tfp pilus assembly protein PilF/MinD-like ATPase involved in chromosome partitioning or flagellar assembly
MSTSKPALEPSERPCPFITFYSFKGGVGRSMAVINVAGIMASRGFRVMVVDMDLEAPGLSFLANQAVSEGASHSLQPGFVDVLLDAVERGSEGDLFRLPAAETISRYSAPYELPEGFRRTDGGSLHIMPAGRIDEDYSARLESLNLPVLYHEGTGLALIKAFKQVVQDARLFDYVLIDSRTGFSDESGICTRDLADYLMVVSGLNKQNVEGTTSFLSTLRRATDERKPLEVILSPIPNGEDALVDEREARAREAFCQAWGEAVPTDLHIPYHPQLALTEEPHIFRRRRGYLFDAYNKIERRLLSLLGETWNVALDSASVALENKDYVTAEANFRRASKLADTQAWADRAILGLDSELLTDVGAEAVLGFMTEQASSRARKSLGRRLRRSAIVCVVKEPDTAEVLFKRAMEVDPNDAVHIGNYATFRWKERKDLEEAEVLYKRAMKADPNHADILGNYASFRCDEWKDLEGAEVLYKRAIDADPNHANNLGNYASFRWNERKDLKGAEALYKRAMEADPNHADSLSNCGSFYLTIGRVTEGMELVDRALTILSGADSPRAIDVECWMYVFCCGEAKRQLPALQQLRVLIEVHSISTDDWDFSGVIRQADTMAHPEASWLPILAEVLGGRQPSTALDDWPAWHAAATR